MLQIDDVKSEDFGDNPHSHRSISSRPGTARKTAGVESTHSVFKSIESQVHQIGVSLESVSAHVAALAQLASLAANSGSNSFGFGPGGNGGATPRLRENLRLRPEGIETRAGQ